MDPIPINNDVIKQLILAYKEFPCLWNEEVKPVASKHEKEKALISLLKIYKQADPKATLFALRKKIQNMRSTYRREYKKILKAKSQGYKHVPVLWYYKYMTFLEGAGQSWQGQDRTQSGDEEEITFITEDQEQQEHEYNDSDDIYIEAQQDSSIDIKSPIYTNYETLDSDEEDVKCFIKDEIPETSTSSFKAQPRIRPSMDSKPRLIPKSPTSPKSEVEYFGKTIGLQLQELDKLQKSIAEKLISEVIFYARLDKLNTDSLISLE